MLWPAPMNWFKSGDLLDRAFAIGITLKGLDGVLEVVGGVLLLVVSSTTIDNMSRALTQHELSEDPHDFLATHLLHAAGSLTGFVIGVRWRCTCCCMAWSRSCCTTTSKTVSVRSPMEKAKVIR